MFIALKKSMATSVLLTALALVSCNATTQQESVTGQTDVDASKANPEKLVVALLPDESVSTVIQNNQSLKEHLENELDKEVELFVSTDYSSMIEAMSRGRLDLAYFGPLSYVLAKTKSDIEPFAALMKDGETTYQAIIVTHAESGIDSLDDVAGKVMAFGDPASTSSHLIPKSMLVERADLTAGEAYEEVFLGAHDAVAIAVQNQNADAGGLSQPIFEALVDKGVIDPETVIVLDESDPYPQYPWAMRSDLDPALKEQISSAFLDLQDETVLDPFNADGFGAIEDTDYDVLRQMTTLLGLDIEELAQ
ncbi:MAG: phosphate/phosphite/phosphonate ABC transporter substrate-binding protein [Cyanobacteria bacterium P01_D01_bin.115]